LIHKSQIASRLLAHVIGSILILIDMKAQF
jgi:hypothetical protein